MRTRTWSAPLAALLLAVGPAPARAGECIDGDEAHYVGRLEQELRQVQPQPPVGEPESAYYCLIKHYTRIGGMTNRWAGPRAAQLIQRRRTSPHRARIARACSAVLRRHPPRLHAGCVLLAASYGVEELDGRSIWELGARYFPDGFPPEQLAVLGGPRALAQLTAAFGRERTCEHAWDSRARTLRPACRPYPDGWRRNRWQRKAHEEAKVAILNALWHLALPGSRAFLEGVAAKDESPLVRERARHALGRLEPPARRGR